MPVAPQQLLVTAVVANINLIGKNEVFLAGTGIIGQVVELTETVTPAW
jgi:N-acetylglutamate synthase/N-acetylornithine aminotransferase